MALAKRKGGYIESPTFKLIHKNNDEGSLASLSNGNLNETVHNGSEISDLVDFRQYDQVNFERERSFNQEDGN